MKKQILISVTVVLLAIIVGVVVGCSSKKDKSRGNNEVVPVSIIELKQEGVKKTIAASGRFTTDDETYLSFKTGGIIRAVYVKEGDAIRAGQVLATLELNEIDAQVSQAKAAYDKALRDFDRASNLYRDSVASLSQMQDAKTALDVAAQNVTIANYNYNHSEIRAISDGYLLKKMANEGQMVGPGTPVFQTNGASKGNWVLKVGVSDYEWNSIKIGDVATIEIDAAKGEKQAAVVSRKSEGVDPFSGTFTVELKLNQQSTKKIASGLFGKAEITPSIELKSWAIPFDAILDGDANVGYVFITNDKQTVKKVKINISEFDKSFVYVTGGLENAKYLIVSGSAYLDEKATIAVEEAR